jgi:hypothetical protein
MTILIIFNGESNSGGYAVNTPASATELAPAEAIKILNNTTMRFEALQVGVNNLLGHDRLTDYSATHHGLELGLANAARDGRFGGEQVLLVKTGQGGSVIEDWTPGNPYYETMLTRIQSAKNLLPFAAIRPILWYLQGINNAKGGNNLPQYRQAAIEAWQAKTLAYHTRIRQVFELGDLPILFSEITPQFPHWNRAIRDIATRQKDCYVVSAEGCTRGDDYHWDYAGFKILADRFVDKSIEVLKPSNSSQNPRKYFAIEKGHYAGVAFLRELKASQRNNYTETPLPTGAIVDSGNCPKYIGGRWINDSSPTAVEISARRHLVGSQQYSVWSNSLIVCDGNSITASVQSGATWPAQLKSSAPFSDIGCTVLNIAVGGQTTPQMNVDAAQQIDAIYDGNKNCVLIAWEIGNDLYFGATVEMACANFKKYCSDRRSIGWRVVAITVADRLHLSGTPGGDTGVQYTAKVLAANDWLRNNWRNFADALVDSRKVPALTNASNPSFFPDGIHPTGAALTGLVEQIKPALIDLLSQ